MKDKLKILITVSVLIAMEIILGRFFSFHTPIVRIGLGFVPIAICAMLYGPIWAGAAAALSDILGMMLFPIGPYFPGFTLSAALSGIVFGLFLHKREGTNARIAGAVAINCLLISLLLSTYWLTILTGTPFLGILPTRIVQNIIMIPVQFVVLKLLQKPMEIFTKRWVVVRSGS